MAPSSGTPATSVMNRTQRVQWMQRFMMVLTRTPTYLSSTARLFSLPSTTSLVMSMPHQHQQQSSGNGDASGHVQPHQQRDATPKPIGSAHPPRSVSHAQRAVFHSCAEGMLSQPNA